MENVRERKKITEILNIKQEELDKITSELKQEEIRDLYEDRDLQISLFKISKKIYEVVYEYGDKPFTEIF